MSEQQDFMELVQRAQQGDKVALDRLAELSVSRLHVYVYRLTLQEDLAQDIVQETMLEMVKILGKLKRTDRFLPWLYGIATNKLRHYYRSEATMRRATSSKLDQEQDRESREEGLHSLLNQELREIITGAIQGLKTRHRAVLIMRCYDGMSYAEIAESMGSTEFGTRMLFIRAKKSLEKQLSRGGLGKGALLSALALFGKMTAPSKVAAAEITVTAATTNAGLAATVLGAAAGKAGLLSATAAGVLAVGVATGTLEDLIGTGADQQTIRPSSQFVQDLPRSEASIEKSYFILPSGGSGPLMFSARGQSGGTGSMDWMILQDRSDNYFYDGKVVHRNNFRAWTPRVMRVPTDSPKMTQFLTEVEGISSRMRHVPAGGNWLLVSVMDDLNQDQPLQQVDRHQPAVMDEDFLQADWPTDTPIVDNRDEMHRRGWTYFNVTGYLQGESIKGTGRVPFVYTVRAKYSPWLRLRMGDLSIVDSAQGARAFDESTGKSTRYPAGTFFSGMLRPWTGFHTIDVIRRAAAERAIEFKTEFSDDQKTADVTLSCPEGLTLDYEVDLRRDVLVRVDIKEPNGGAGWLSFDYQQTLNTRGGNFTAPSVTASRSGQAARMGGLWLEKLVAGQLVD